MAKQYEPNPNQLALIYDPPHARQTDPGTSYQAAAKINIRGVRLLILHELCLRPTGLATFQIAQRLDRDRDSISPHMKPMMRHGLVNQLSATTINPKTNNHCHLWAITEKGKQVYLEYSRALKSGDSFDE